jgi:hypothetical protein
MKKIGVLLCISLLAAGCSSNQSKEEIFIDAAKACSHVCEEYPNISEVSSSAGAGLPLLFVGGMETTCQCSR